MLKTKFKTNSKIEFIKFDHEGLAKVLAQFVELYKVCENKELLDRCLELLICPQMIQDLSIKDITL